ncbi:Hypothetical predicted protein [Olea europaea subsp. europaea]|uniref:Uncharacterized protein n=1 Tax=Olea europaea subsp. europaea TaxID=158383 RepID=A0A8S0PFB5_OLEEU|nr:Hypothetical predicted protein [Olea europaea subsp. europaea]
MYTKTKEPRARTSFPLNARLQPPSFRTILPLNEQQIINLPCSHPPFTVPQLHALFFCPHVTDFHRMLNLSGENSASGSPLLNRLDENRPAVVADDLMNVGLANDLVLLHEMLSLLDKPSSTLDSDNGKNRWWKIGDFIPL